MPLLLRLRVLALWILAAGASDKLRVGLGADTFPPWVFRDATTGTYEGGFLVEFYRELGTVMGKDVEFVPITDQNYYNDFIGTVTRLLEANQIDTSWDSSRFIPPDGFLATPSLFQNEK